MGDLNRDELGRKIYEISKSVADGYRRNILSHTTENATNEKCACAASNTGYFILQALGYQKEDLDRFRAEFEK